MGRMVNATVSGMLVLGLAVAGCGESSSTSSSTRSDSASQTSSSGQTGTSTGTSTGTGAGTQTSNGKPSGQTATSSTPKEHVPTNVLRISSPAFKEGDTIPARYACDGSRRVTASAMESGAPRHRRNRPVHQRS